MRPWVVSGCLTFEVGFGDAKQARENDNPVFEPEPSIEVTEAMASVKKNNG